MKFNIVFSFEPSRYVRFYWTFSSIIYNSPRNEHPPFSLSLSQVHITQYADSVASHLAKILDSDKHSDVISSAKYVTRTPSKNQAGEKEKREKCKGGGSR